MTRNFLTTVSGVAAAAFLSACSSVDSFVKTADEARPGTPVQFTYEAVSPPTVSIAPEGNVTWTNMALDAVGFVVFPASIATSFRCSELRPHLTRLQSGAYRSPPITGAMGSERAQLPCSLAPGSYDYEVWLMGEGFGEEGMPAKPQNVLHGKIVVQ